MLTIVTPNTDRTLLTIEEARVAYGLASDDGSKDPILTPLIDYVSAMITKACKVPRGGAVPPTLRLEEVKDKYSFKSQQKNLVLSRKPVTEIVSVSMTGSALGLGEYELDSAAGIFYRVNASERSLWPIGFVEVQYKAGYETVPADLKYAAILYIQDEQAQGSRDPNLKSLTIEGVSSRTWWVNPPSDSVIPEKVMRTIQMGGYRTPVIA